MRMSIRGLGFGAAALAMMLAPASAIAKKPKYAKTEVEKAAAKCVGTVLGGALVGALVGRLIDKKGAGTGAAIGAGGGAVLCGILIANAKHRDRMIRAQMAAMNDPRRSVTERWTDDNGQTTTFTTKAGDVRTIAADRLTPVRYETAAGKVESPVLDTGNRECRMAAGTLTSGNSVATVPAQLYCRTDAGDWQPFAEASA